MINGTQKVDSLQQQSMRRFAVLAEPLAVIPRDHDDGVIPKICAIEKVEIRAT